MAEKEKKEPTQEDIRAGCFAWIFMLGIAFIALRGCPSTPDATQPTSSPVASTTPAAPTSSPSLTPDVITNADVEKDISKQTSASTVEPTPAVVAKTSPVTQPTPTKTEKFQDEVVRAISNWSAKSIA